MEDRELLELAAKTVGYDISHSLNAYRMVLPNPVVGLCIPGVSTCWNPLEDDGDAFRLASRMNLEVDFGNNMVVTPSEVWGEGTDPYAATRRAIVRAAAIIGSKK